jgi:hypothetical protein
MHSLKKRRLRLTVSAYKFTCVCGSTVTVAALSLGNCHCYQCRTAWDLMRDRRGAWFALENLTLTQSPGPRTLKKRGT